MYGKHILNSRLVDGREAVDIFRIRQPPGHYPDAPVNQYVMQFNVGPTVNADADVGLGLKAIPMRRGELVIAPPNTSADYQTSTSLDFISFGLPINFVDAAAAHLNIERFSVEPLLGYAVQDHVIRHLIQDIWREACRDLSKGALFIDASLMSLSNQLVGLASKGRPRPAPSRHKLSSSDFAMLCEYIDSNIDTNVRMASLARLTGMPDHKFARAFKATTGKSPHQWVIDRRLDRAEQFLGKSRISLAEIAYACGFSSQAHMTTLFSERRGVTPAEYRNSLQA
ncbi:AraC family transcriptional regulator [Gymnodinialimonas sp. 2305UL16-5]